MEWMRSKVKPSKWYRPSPDPSHREPSGAWAISLIEDGAPSRSLHEVCCNWKIEGFGDFEGRLSEAKTHVVAQRLRSPVVVTQNIEANDEKALVIAMNHHYQPLQCGLPVNKPWIFEPRSDFSSDRFHNARKDFPTRNLHDIPCYERRARIRNLLDRYSAVTPVQG